MDKLEYIPDDLAFHYIPKTIIKKYVKVYVCSTQNALSLEDMDGNLYDYIGELYPIPLTPEILEKNGWEKVSDYNYSHPRHKFSIVSRKEEAYKWSIVVGGFGFGKYISCVSDLQHFLFGIGLNHEMKV